MEVSIQHSLGYPLSMKKIQRTVNYAFILGIDVSKESLDACLIGRQDGQVAEQKFNNNPEGFKKLKTWLRQQGAQADSDTLVCMEHTGLYTRRLVHYLLAREMNVWLESALHIKRSMGLVRGKDDKIDAQRIARYAYLQPDKAVLLNLSGTTLEKLKDLQANRTRLLKAIHSLKVATKELLRVDSESGKTIEKINKEAVKGLEKSLEQVEEKLTEFIENDVELKRKYDLLTSIKGVGKVLAISLLVYTNGFDKLLDARKLACYCGVAPFEHKSGTSVFGPVGVSQFANQDLKRVLHLAAISSVCHNEELKAYFQRKVKQGKKKMSVINAVRNKLLHQIVAVIKRGTPYEIRLPDSEKTIDKVTVKIG
jgi:transposase